MLQSDFDALLLMFTDPNVMAAFDHPPSGLNSCRADLNEVLIINTKLNFMW